MRHYWFLDLTNTLQSCGTWKHVCCNRILRIIPKPATLLSSPPVAGSWHCRPAITISTRSIQVRTCPKKASITISLMPYQWHSLPVACCSHQELGKSQYNCRAWQQTHKRAAKVYSQVILVLSSTDCQLTLSVYYCEDCGPLFVWKASSGALQHFSLSLCRISSTLLHKNLMT